MYGLEVFCHDSQLYKECLVKISDFNLRNVAVLSCQTFFFSITDREKMHFRTNGNFDTLYGLDVFFTDSRLYKVCLVKISYFYLQKRSSFGVSTKFTGFSYLNYLGPLRNLDVCIPDSQWYNVYLVKSSALYP